MKKKKLVKYANKIKKYCSSILMCNMCIFSQYNKDSRICKLAEKIPLDWKIKKVK